MCYPNKQIRKGRDESRFTKTNTAKINRRSNKGVVPRKKDDLGFDIEKAMFPVNPLLIDETKISIEDAVYLVEQWNSVRDSVWDSVRDIVWDSVRDIVCAYMSSIFYGIDDWKRVDHEKGNNPFKPAIDLWEAGYIASYDGEKWRLHIGKDAKIVWSGKFDEGDK